MSEAKTNAGVRECTVSARVIRADGTVEDLGVIAAYHRNPLRRWWMQRQIRKREHQQGRR